MNKLEKFDFASLTPDAVSGEAMKEKQTWDAMRYSRSDWEFKLRSYEGQFRLLFDEAGKLEYVETYISNVDENRNFRMNLNTYTDANGVIRVRAAVLFYDEYNNNRIGGKSAMVTAEHPLKFIVTYKGYKPRDGNPVPERYSMQIGSMQRLADAIWEEILLPGKYKAIDHAAVGIARIPDAELRAAGTANKAELDKMMGIA